MKKPDFELITLKMKSNQLEEVNIIRPYIIVLLVIMHSFTPYGGAWPLPDGIHNVQTYFWIQRFTYSSILEMFVFISGYLFAYQIYCKKKVYTFPILTKEKLKRLILPSVVFSIIYLFLFPLKEQSFFTLCYKVLCGVSHLWFLPMLFWCFVATYFIYKLKIREELKLLVLLLISSVLLIPLPLQMTVSMYYLFFFYAGFYFLRKRETIIKSYISMYKIILLLCLYVCVFVPLSVFNDNLQTLVGDNLIMKAGVLSLTRINRIVYSSLGVLVIYMIAQYIIKMNIQIPRWIIQFNALCMGVYIVHHFILEHLYYQTGLPQFLGTYWLPWGAFVITFITSVVIVYLLCRTKLGRELL